MSGEPMTLDQAVEVVTKIVQRGGPAPFKDGTDALEVLVSAALGSRRGCAVTLRSWLCRRREARYWRFVDRLVARGVRVGCVPVDWHATSGCRCGR